MESLVIGTVVEGEEESSAGLQMKTPLHRLMSVKE